MFTLRGFENADAEVVLSWITDEFSFHQWSADKYESYPPKAEEMLCFYNEMKLNGAKLFVFYDDDRAIGHFILRPLPDQNVKTVRIGFIIVDSTIRGEGYGRRMLECALDYAFNTLGAQRVTLGVFENNPNARKCYESVGFKQWSESSVHINNEVWKCLEMECIK